MSSEDPAAHAARDGVQHRKSHDRVGHEQACRQHAATACRADRAGTSRRSPPPAAPARRRQRHASTRSGQGRRSRPETFTIRAGEPEIEDIEDVSRHRGGRRNRDHQDVDHAPGIGAAGNLGLALGAQRPLECAAELGLEGSPCRCRNSSTAATTTSVPMIAAHKHEAADRIPFDRRRRSVGRDRPRQQRQIAEPPGRQSDAEQEGEEEIEAEHEAERRSPRAAAATGRPSGSSRGRRSGSAAARDRTAAIAMSEPDATDANSSAAAAPAPSPTRTICTIASCPASSAVRGGSRPPQPSAATVSRGGLAVRLPLREASSVRSIGSRRAAARGSARA